MSNRSAQQREFYMIPRGRGAPHSPRGTGGRVPDVFCNVHQGVGLHDFSAEQSGVELSFARGQVLDIIEVQTPEGWLMARSRDGASGLVPANWITTVPRAASEQTGGRVRRPLSTRPSSATASSSRAFALRGLPQVAPNRPAAASATNSSRTAATMASASTSHLAVHGKSVRPAARSLMTYPSYDTPFPTTKTVWQPSDEGSLQAENPQTESMQPSGPQAERPLPVQPTGPPIVGEGSSVHEELEQLDVLFLEERRLKQTVRVNDRRKKEAAAGGEEEREKGENSDEKGDEKKGSAKGDGKGDVLTSGEDSEIKGGEESAKQSDEDSERPETDWTCVSWLESIKATSAVANALLHAFPQKGSQLEMVRSLMDASEAVLAERLTDGLVAERLAALLRPELQKLKTMAASSGEELHSKFAHEVAEGKGFQLKYADLSTFYGYLHREPNPQVFC